MLRRNRPGSLRTCKSATVAYELMGFRANAAALDSLNERELRTDGSFALEQVLKLIAKHFDRSRVSVAMPTAGYPEPSFVSRPCGSHRWRENWWATALRAQRH